MRYASAATLALVTFSLVLLAHVCGRLSRECERNAHKFSDAREAGFAKRFDQLTLMAATLNAAIVVAAALTEWP